MCDEIPSVVFTKLICVDCSTILQKYNYQCSRVTLAKTCISFGDIASVLGYRFILAGVRYSGLGLGMVLGSKVGGWY